jgi:UDP-N-acetylglucosamine pyrophosphorylase
MSNIFIETITSTEPKLRNRSFHALCDGLSTTDLLTQLQDLEQFRHRTNNLYESVRACLFLYEAYRFILESAEDIPAIGKLPYSAYTDLLDRRFEQAVEKFSELVQEQGLNANLASGLAEAYHHLTFQLLSDQVRKSVRSSQGNRWMFRIGHMEELPIKIHRQLLRRDDGEKLYPILEEKTSVRMDLTHSGWSDIFFLGMDYPEGARVINVSVDLGVYGRDESIEPPISAYVRVIEEPLLRLTSVDLKATKDIRSLDDLFNFGNDYLSLLKAGVIASGMIPSAFEGTRQPLSGILSKVVGLGMGLELVTKVNDIPKGSRLAVSTNLLGCIISALMRATQQTATLEGQLTEPERRLVASRAILGEWLGGSGGGWQDSGGVWPGIKIIQGALAEHGDPEFGVSRGCLLPRHKVLKDLDIHPEIDKRLANSLVLMHGGMAQNVGPILEMVTEKYLLRKEKEWVARAETSQIFEQILEALKEGDIKKLAKSTQHNWDYPIKTIIPWASTHFTERIIEKAKARLGHDFWGFLMLGGMSGGGMGMFVNPDYYEEHRETILQILKETKAELSTSLPFAMEPVVYNFRINHKGTFATLKSSSQALMPESYYSLLMPGLVHEADELSDTRKVEFNRFVDTAARQELLPTMVSHLFKVSQPSLGANKSQQDELANTIKRDNGFDFIQHEQLRRDLIKGRIGLSRNRLPAETRIEDVEATDLAHWSKLDQSHKVAHKAIQEGRVGVLSLAGGVGSRWTKGAGVIKALNPFAEFEGHHRSFLEIHLNKTKQASELFQTVIPHIFATSHLTQRAIQDTLAKHENFDYAGPIFLSPGRSIGQRFIPMERDLRFLWEETSQEVLDENKQKVQTAVRNALINWAKSKGEGNDYVDNVAEQRFSPLGHWYEVSNLFRNGTLCAVLQAQPQLETLMLHNIDTLGANLNIGALGQHLDKGKVLSFEVIPRRIEDRGGGLARINGKPRILEGLAQPREEDELNLSYYNSMTTWIQIDQLLQLFGLDREDILQNRSEKIDEAVRYLAHRMPTYVTIKDVKYRWGHGQEDIYPVAQVEKLWSDMTALPEVEAGFIAVPRKRGQQLKSPDQLDAWANDGSKAYIAQLCGWKL